MSTTSKEFSRATVTQAATTATRITYLDLFRGIAILQVVMIHAGNALLLRGVSPAVGDTGIVTATLHILAHDSTIYFAMISGILYGHLFSRRGYRAFMTARFFNVGMPYVVVSVILTLLFWLLSWWRTNDNGDLGALAEKLIVNIATGDAWNTMWYIPLILVLYMLSPLIFAVVRDPRWRWFSVVMMLLPLIFSRTGSTLTPSMFIYFAGVYVVGLTLGTRLDSALDWMEARIFWLWAIALAATALLIFMFAVGVDMIGSVSLRESAFYLQRLALGSLMLLGLRAWSSTIAPLPGRVLGGLAATSFGIYFVHGPLLRPIARAVGIFMPGDQPWWALTLAILATFLIGLGVSLALVRAIQSLAGPYSRRIVGA